MKDIPYCLKRILLQVKCFQRYSIFCENSFGEHIVELKASIARGETIFCTYVLGHMAINLLLHQVSILDQFFFCWYTPKDFTEVHFLNVYFLETHLLEAVVGASFSMWRLSDFCLEGDFLCEAFVTLSSFVGTLGTWKPKFSTFIYLL